MTVLETTADKIAFYQRAATNALRTSRLYTKEGRADLAQRETEWRDYCLKRVKELERRIE